MASMIKITGLNTILRNFKKADSKLGDGLEKRLKDAGLFIQRESQKIVPVDTSNLKGGAETRSIGGKGFKAHIVVLYKAVYSVFVHENMGARHKTGKRAKFLEAVVREKKNEIFKIIKG